MSSSISINYVSIINKHTLRQHYQQALSKIITCYIASIVIIQTTINYTLHYSSATIITYYTILTTILYTSIITYCTILTKILLYSTIITYNTILTIILHTTINYTLHNSSATIITYYTILTKYFILQQLFTALHHYTPA